MIIRSMTANFGVLDGRSIAFEDGLNIVTAPNESGKSTWCAFIRTMLYGLDTSAREKQGAKPDRIKYAPWSKTAMSGSMDIEYEGRCITVRRWTDKATAPMQAFSVTYTGTDEPVPGLTAENLGEKLTGVPRGVYERSAFIRQSGMALTNSEELEKHINAILSGGSEGLSYTEVSKKLSAWQRHRKPGGRGTAELLQQKTENEDTMRRLRETAAETAALDAQIEQLRQERTAAVKHMEAARAAHRKRALEEMMSLRKRVQATETQCADAKTALDEREEALHATVFRTLDPEEAAKRVRELKRRARSLEEQAHKTLPLWVGFLFLVLFAAAAAAGVLLPAWRAVLWCVGGVCLVLAEVWLVCASRRQKRARSILSERQKLLGRAGVDEEAELDDALAQYEMLWDKKESARRQYETLCAQLSGERERQKYSEEQLVQGLDFSRGDSEAAQAGREVERLDAELETLKERRARTEGHAAALGDPLVIGSELAGQNAKLDTLAEEYDAIGLALEVLAEADGELQSRFSPELSRKAAQYFAELTGGRYDEITLSRDLSAKARRSGEVVGRETAYLSEGTGDQLYLALRLAVCELAMPKGTSCPMVLDDALVNFDGERLVRALERIRELAQTRQIILFSCHERERDYFGNDPAVNTIAAGL